MLLVISASPIGAQQYTGLTPGARVRIARAASDTAARFSSTGSIERQIQGKFVSLSQDSIVIQEEDDTLPLSLPLTAVDHVDVVAGKSRMKSMAIGALLGGLAGAAIGAASSSDQPFLLGGRGIAAAEVGTVGVVLGGLIGLAVGSERWQPVNLPTRLSIVPLRGGGAKVGLTMQF
jgi:hypothetical protein